VREGSQMVGGGVSRLGEADEADMAPSGERREVELDEVESGGESDMARCGCGWSV
jgi:hypothetical protein